MKLGCVGEGWWGKSVFCGWAGRERERERGVSLVVASGRVVIGDEWREGRKCVRTEEIERERRSGQVYHSVFQV